MDTAAARNLMVDCQVRPNKVTDPRIIAAMRRLPRERFVPPQAAPLAYADADVPLGRGRVLMEPMAIARLVQAAALRPGEKALVVAAGSGYGAALLAACGAAVTALEDDPALLALARVALADHAPGVTLVAGPPAAGWAQGAPYDVVLIDGAVEEIPPALVAQLKPAAGRLLCVCTRPGSLGHAVLAEPVAGGPSPGGPSPGGPSPGRLARQVLFDCATPPLPALQPAPGFVF